MICPFCTQHSTRVTNSRPRKKTARVWRRRECQTCWRIFSTNEAIALQDDIRVIDTHATESIAYNRGILLMSIADSFAHNPAKGRQAAWWLTETAEEYILTKAREAAPEAPEGPYTVHSSDISSLTHQVIGRYDTSAAIQYAARHNIALA